MTIQEAIEHCKEVAQKQKEQSEIGRPYEGEDCNIKYREDCAECSKDHEQLAMWLEELLRYKQSSNSDCINKTATINAIEDCYCKDCNNYNGAMCRACEHMDDMDIIDSQPTVNPTITNTTGTKYICKQTLADLYKDKVKHYEELSNRPDFSSEERNVLRELSSECGRVLEELEYIPTTEVTDITDSLVKLFNDIGLDYEDPIGTLRYILEQYQKIVIEITGSFFSKITYDAQTVLSKARDLLEDSNQAYIQTYRGDDGIYRQRCSNCRREIKDENPRYCDYCGSEFCGDGD